MRKPVLRGRYHNHL